MTTQNRDTNSKQAPNKSNMSALCIVPDARAWEQIQLARCFDDKSFVRWPPHINLLYPFLEDRGDSFLAAAAAAQAVCRNFQPFQIHLNSIKHFVHARNATLWLDPQSEEVGELQAALAAAFPDCQDLNCDPLRGITHFIPHLSIGQFKNAEAAEAAGKALAANWRPISINIDAVCLISRTHFKEPFRIRYEVPLGGTGQVAQLDVPYVATAGPLATLHASPSGRYGIGGRNDGVEYFAFGANISISKLTGSRKITPLESRAASIEGYRLEFNHRGGFGNLVALRDGERAPSGLTAVHGVVHRLRPSDFATLTNMEHEYWPMQLEADVYDRHGGGKIPCVAFCSPPERTIADGLPPTDRYLSLLQSGAREWPLLESYCDWLDSIQTVASNMRGDRHYRSAVDGSKMAAWPKIRIGSQQRGEGGGGGNRGRGN